MRLPIWMVMAMLAMARPASACAVCTGAPGDPLVEGANRGIWVLLGIIFAVQIGFIALFWTFWRRARQLKKFREQFHVVHGVEAPLPPPPPSPAPTFLQRLSSASSRLFRRSLATVGINFSGGSQ